tara:strand:- start:88 stop:306 length:219 start_codon:yes stop_codon:yes gene_type:complete
MGINMEVVPGKNEDPIRAIKRFVKKCKKEGFLREVVERSRHKKASDVRRLKKVRRKKVLQKLQKEQDRKNRN